MKAVLYFCLVATVFAGPTRLSLTPRLDGRIVGGSDVTIDQYPYQISLLANGEHDCGGSIISYNWVLTAAHCINDGVIYSVRAGSSLRNSGGKVYTVKQIISHQGYDTWTNDNDIAVIQIFEEFDLGNSQEIIPLAAKSEDVAVGTAAVATGWGVTGPEGYSTVLQEVTVPVLSQESCKDAYGSIVSDNMICAGYSAGGRDTCQGDSGGPLVARGQQIGIVSWGYGCAEAGYPGVYARVSALRDWIKQNSGV